MCPTYLNDVMEQLEGQIASAKVAMARLSSPQPYYVLLRNDFTLDVNNPYAPKIVCIGNSAFIELFKNTREKHCISYTVEF